MGLKHCKCLFAEGKRERMEREQRRRQSIKKIQNEFSTAYLVAAIRYKVELDILERTVNEQRISLKQEYETTVHSKYIEYKRRLDEINGMQIVNSTDRVQA